MTTETSNSTLESTRRLASEALERASTTVKEMRSGVHDAASRGMSAVTDRATAARPCCIRSSRCWSASRSW